MRTVSRQTRIEGTGSRWVNRQFVLVANWPKCEILASTLNVSVVPEILVVAWISFQILDE